MSFETSSEPQTSSQTREGLSTFWFSSPSKMDLQLANELFDKYAESGDPQVLWKINELKLNAMKSSAEAELARLEKPQTREEIEAQMTLDKASKSAANDRLSYVLVTYIRNVENLDAKRKTEVATITEGTSARVSALKSDVWRIQQEPWVAQTPSADVQPSTPSEEISLWDLIENARRKSMSEDAAPVDAEKAFGTHAETKSETLDAEGQKNRKFIQENRGEIDRLIAKLPAGEKNQAAKILIGNPKTDNIWLFQEKVLAMKGTGPTWVDGRFGQRTLNALRVAVGEKQTEAPQGKPSAEIAKAPSKTKTDGVAHVEPQRQSAAAAEKAFLEKEAAAKARVEWTALDLQKNVLKHLRPLGNDLYVVETKFFEDGFTGAMSFKFDKNTQEWSWLAFADPKLASSNGKWSSVSELEAYTVNGSTAMKGFQFNSKTQETVNAILAARAFSLTNAVALQSPSTQSKAVQWIPT